MAASKKTKPVLSDTELKLVNDMVKKGTFTVKYSDLARGLKMTKTGAYLAVDKLKKKGILRRVQPEFDLEKLGYDFTAFVLIKIDPVNVPGLAKKYKKNKFVTSIYEVSGEFDLLFICKFKSHSQLQQILNELRDVEAVAGIDYHTSFTPFKEELNPWPV
ncbi:MAG: Lrp/AsnC family transcriptional regulator, partial [Candidatus Diapherotrites archaeon]|nr:Lrp/AsnC family transcriptional regulator [Candidatus Diapherotrites archaeon]